METVDVAGLLVVKVFNFGLVAARTPQGTLDHDTAGYLTPPG